MRSVLERAGRVLAVALVGVVGAWAALLLVGPLEYAVGPFDVGYFLRPGPGRTDIALPPFGRLIVDTHTGPLHLTATLQNVDPGRTTELVRAADLDTLAARLQREALGALRTHALRVLGIGAVGATLAGILVFRRRWPGVVGALLAGTLVLASTQLLAWATYRREAFLEPTFQGSLRVASRLLGPIQDASARLSEFRSEIGRLASQALAAYEGLAGARAPSSGAVTVLHISDLHASPLGMDFALELAASFDVDVVLDTGDITTFGTPLETGLVERIPTFGVPYLFVRGNHDSSATVALVADQPNAVVLDGDTDTVAGLDVYGLGHPLYTPDPRFDLDDEEIAVAVREVGEDLVADVTGDEPDVVAVHDDRMASVAAGRVPLVVSGHFHQAAQYVREGTLFLRTGSTGGGGLDTFTSEVRPYPLSAEVLYFDGTPPELVAVDLVELDPDTRDLTVDRQLATDLLEVPVPAPSPTGG